METNPWCEDQILTMFSSVCFFNRKLAVYFFTLASLDLERLEKKRFLQDWYNHMLGHKIFNEHIHYQ